MTETVQAGEQLPEFPFYYKDKISVIHPEEGYVGVVTFWTQFNSDKYLPYTAVLSLGNLYTADGFKYIVLNSFVSSKLSVFGVFYGNDRNSVYPMILDLFSIKCSII